MRAGQDNNDQGAEVDTVVVGASLAGLAVAACLRRAGVSFVLLEQGNTLSPPWHRHYDRLHLHTNKGSSHLPHARFPSRWPRYPSRQQVLDYLAAYAEQNDLHPRFGQRVTSVRRVGELWHSSCEPGKPPVRSRHVVLATGMNRVPHRPQWPGLDSFGGPVLHSAEYRNAETFVDKEVLVVGIGNSGAEIALELCEGGARPSLAVRSPVNVIPRQLLGLPIIYWAMILGVMPYWLSNAFSRLVSRLTVGGLESLGLRRLPMGPIAQIRQQGRYPVIDVGTVARIRQGDIPVLPGPQSFSAGRVTFSDGSERAFDAVVLATGYRPALSALLAAEHQDALRDDGFPLRSGQEVLPGLYFCGFRHTPTGLIREIAIESRRIARSISRDQGKAPALPAGRDRPAA